MCRDPRRQNALKAENRPRSQRKVRTRDRKATDRGQKGCGPETEQLRNGNGREQNGRGWARAGGKGAGCVYGNGEVLERIDKKGSARETVRKQSVGDCAGAVREGPRRER